MRKILFLLLTICSLALPAAAQFTLVTGTVKDVNGLAYAGGTISAQLVVPGGASPTLNGVGFTGVMFPIGLDSNGSFTARLADNNVILPSGTQWKFQVNIVGVPAPLGTGPQTCLATLTITGASQSVSASFSACPALSNVAAATSLVFSGITSGTNTTAAMVVGSGASLKATGTGIIAGADTGVFTTGQHNEIFQFTLGTCPLALIIGGATAVTDALMGCANTPSSGVTNSFTDGLAGYVQVNDPNQGGQFGKVEGVGVYGAVRCAANNTKCLGMAPQAESVAGLTGVTLEGSEIGVFPGNTTDVGFGLLMVSGGSAQPTGDNLPAISLQPGASQWTGGYECQDGSTSTNVCVFLGKTASGVAHDSQLLKFSSTNLSGTNFTSQIGGIEDNSLAVENAAFLSVLNPSGAEEYTVALTSTAALSNGQLVKIDPANPNAVVVCTTADIVCFGFVAGTSYLCGINGVDCEIATVPGSKVVGILGTGTCAIGSFVIVDTTTNGDIKCVSTAPQIGASLGRAISSQAVIGGAVNIWFLPDRPATGITSSTYATATNCAANSVSPAACGSAVSGVFAVPTTTTSYTVNTTAVTANSRIILQEITDNSGIPSAPTCVSTLGNIEESARVAGTSFSVTLTSVAGITCYNYWIVN